MIGWSQSFSGFSLPNSSCVFLCYLELVLLDRWNKNLFYIYPYHSIYVLGSYNLRFHRGIILRDNAGIACWNKAYSSSFCVVAWMVSYIPTRCTRDSKRPNCRNTFVLNAFCSCSGTTKARAGTKYVSSRSRIRCACCCNCELSRTMFRRACARRAASIVVLPTTSEFTRSVRPNLATIRCSVSS